MEKGQDDPFILKKYRLRKQQFLKVKGVVDKNKELSKRSRNLKRIKK